MYNLVLRVCVVCLLLFVSVTITRASDQGNSSILPPDTIVVPHDRPPKFAHEVEPEYPRLAMEGGFSSWVEVTAFVDTAGKIISATVRTNRPKMGFEESVLKAAYESEFEPARLKKKPVGVWIKYRVTFDPKYGVKRKALTSHDLK